MTPESILDLQDVSVSYRFRPRLSLARTLTGRNAPRTIVALRSLTLSVSPGQVVAAVGHNGAGKTTLLSVVVGGVRPSNGIVHRTVAPTPLLDLTAGFSLSLSGRENALVKMQLLGLSRREAVLRLDEVLAFADLPAAQVDAPALGYSSGMLLRLAFAASVTTRPQLLVVDEVLAVGDLGFQSRCTARISELRKEGCAIIMASHALAQVEDVADRAVWLDAGVVRAQGPAVDVVRAYRRQGDVPLETDARHDVDVVLRGPEERHLLAGVRDRVEVALRAAVPRAGAVRLQVKLRREGLGVLSNAVLAVPTLSALGPPQDPPVVAIELDLYAAEGDYHLDVDVLDNAGKVLGSARGLVVYTLRNRPGSTGILECNVSAVFVSDVV